MVRRTPRISARSPDSGGQARRALLRAVRSWALSWGDLELMAEFDDLEWAASGEIARVLELA